jgi:hypothetical protein
MDEPTRDDDELGRLRFLHAAAVEEVRRARAQRDALADVVRAQGRLIAAWQKQGIRRPGVPEIRQWTAAAERYRAVAVERGALTRRAGAWT